MTARVSGPNAGDLLVEVMREHGIDTAFGVVSVHNLPLVDAVTRELRFVPVRGEAAAVNAADGYGRARDGAGVAITSTGTGAGNAAGALVEALTAGTAVVHLTGQIELEHLGQGRGVIHETKDQLSMLAAVSKAAFGVLDTEHAASMVSDAFAEAIEVPRGPVSLEWPIDLQYRRQAAAVPTEPTPRSAPPVSVDAAVEMIVAARRPLVWAGGGARWSRAELSEFLDRTGAGLLTSNAGRGVIPEDDERVIGNFATSGECAGLLASADLVISIGTHHRSNETNHYQLQLPSAHLQIDLDPAAIGRVYPATVGLVGNASDVLAALNAALATRPVAVDPEWAANVRAARLGVREDLRAAIGPQAEICDALRAELPRDAVIARDVTIPVSQWGNRLLEIYDPCTNIYARGGGIGQGLAMGIGAAIARPGAPTVVLAGDGGLCVQLGELVTLAQEQPWLVLVVFNDRGYGVLRNMQDRYFTHRAGVDLTTPNFGDLAHALELGYDLVTDASAFRKTFATALVAQAPWIIEVDVDAIGETPRMFVPPVHIPEGA